MGGCVHGAMEGGVHKQATREMRGGRLGNSVGAVGTATCLHWNPSSTSY